MECASLHSFYFSAPTSPSRPQPTESSSFGYESGADKTKNDEFEFEFEYRLPSRANSFSAISFADELFCNGQMLPLKPPPRLQSSAPTSPRPFSSRVRNRFTQRCTWNDGFDPFVNALEKVSEETEGRVSVHRRSRSYSPFRANSISRRANFIVDSDQDKEKEQTAPKMVECKGSVYSRWVKSQTMVKKKSEWSMQRNPSALAVIKRSCLGRKEPLKPVKPNEPTSSKESKMQKIKSVLLRYASLKKENNEIQQTRETKAIKRLSHSFKTKTKESAEPKKAIVKQDTKLSRRFIYPQGGLKWL